ncbi:hypothetical protein G5V57_14025 [Nordella sp. HKS 07]|uniref:hypothetical protein n=1 Tax=Nordella sp. HKS 07 TaxID=2712222 RepID=UPI0013E10747|nr:hypothetical protein [Nordella sp. HKS 07]QIG48744.1 hypothetical protein G5V57_14025 [Nordella sp. HKS 07]
MQEASAKRGAKLVVVTLEVVLEDRGSRALDDEERVRIREIYEEGYASRDFSDMIVTDVQNPAAMACRIAAAVFPAPNLP